MVNEIKTRPNIDHDTLFGILNETIHRECQYKISDYILKDIRMIPDFKSELTLLVNDIMKSFSSSYLQDLEYFYTSRYIIRYVTKNVKTVLINFTQEKKIKTK